MRHCAADPVYFARNVLNLRRLPTDAPDVNWELDPWQAQALQALADPYRKSIGLPTLVNHDAKRYVTVRSMHGPGKTFESMTAAHWFTFCFPAQTIVIAPKYRQITTRSWGEFRKILARAEPWYRAAVDPAETRITFFGDRDWAIFAESAKKPENLAGKHWPYQLVIVEEATGIDENLWPVIYGALSTVGGLQQLLMISNPTRNSGEFADSHLAERTSRMFYRMAVRLEDSSRVDRAWVENLRKKYGETSPIFRIRCLGDFATDDANQLIASSWIAAAYDREFEPDGSVPRLRVSVDVADGGLDESVVTVGEHYASRVRLVKQCAYSFAHDMAQVEAADAAEGLFLAHGGDKARDDFVVDAVGVGTGCAGILVSRGYRVIRYKGGSDATDPKRWRNRRVQSYMVLRDALRDGLLTFGEAFSDDPTEVQAQLCSIRINPGTERLEDLQTKERMRQDGIKSPDRADSIAMQFATQAPTVRPGARAPVPRIAAGESTILDGLVS